jgi:hypothetical protein
LGRFYCMRPPSVHREVVFEETVSFEARLEEIDVDRLRRFFSALFDRAASAVNRAGFDLDDAVIENAVLCGCDESIVEVPIGFFSDRAALMVAVERALSGQDDIVRGATGLVILGVRSRVLVERWNDGAVR